jgi:hypothetical protein
LANEQKAVDEHIAEQDRLLNEKKKDGQSDILKKFNLGGLIDMFDTFTDSLLEAYEENATGIKVGSNSTRVGSESTPMSQFGAAPLAMSVSAIGQSVANTGAEIAAMKADTDNMNLATGDRIWALQPWATNNNSSDSTVNTITYNSNNVPDRTSWMLTPMGSMFR